MSETKTLALLREMEERIEVLETAFRGLLYSEAVDAQFEKRRPLGERDGSLHYDLHQAALEEPGNARRRRILERAIALLAGAMPA